MANGFGSVILVGSRISYQVETLRDGIFREETRWATVTRVSAGAVEAQLRPADVVNGEDLRWFAHGQYRR